MRPTRAGRGDRRAGASAGRRPPRRGAHVRPRRQPVGIGGVEGQRDERFRHLALLPAATAVVAREECGAARGEVGAVAVHPPALRLQHVEVPLAEQRYRPPAPAAVVGADQPEEGRQVVAAVGVAGAEHGAWPDDREAHRVLHPVAHALHAGLAGRRAEEAGVGGHEERPVLRIDPEAVGVDGPGIARARHGRGPGVVPAAAGRRCQRCGEREARDTRARHPGGAR